MIITRIKPPQLPISAGDYKYNAPLGIVYMFFIDQPELFYTVNVVPGILYKNISVTVFLGIVLLLPVFFILAARKKNRFIDKHFNELIFMFFIILWMPLYVNFFYNNFYDAIENNGYSRYSENGKRIIRFCNMDNRGGGGDLACRMFSFIKLANGSLPEKARIKILASSPFLKTYFNYYLFPRFNAVNNIGEADYLLYYFSDDYIYKDNILYKAGRGRQGEATKETRIGEYSLVNSMGPVRLILKKIVK